MWSQPVTQRILSRSGKFAHWSIWYSTDVCAVYGRGSGSLFFINKIRKIRDGLQSGQSNIEPVYGTDKCTSQFSTFDPATLAEVSKIIKRSPPKSCMLDPLPSHLLKKNLELLVGAITQIVNTSLASGEFPSLFKRAVISPLIKKASLTAMSWKITDLSLICPLSRRCWRQSLRPGWTPTCLKSPYAIPHSLHTSNITV